MSGCHYCGATDDLRPYGPGGTPVCFPCGSAPERRADTEAAMAAVMNAAAAMSDIGSVVLTPSGPNPFTAADVAKVTP